MSGSAESRNTLVGRLKSAALDAQTDGTDWLSEGDFTIT
jgi:hypothetical protein